MAKVLMEARRMVMMVMMGMMMMMMALMHRPVQSDSSCVRVRGACVVGEPHATPGGPPRGAQGTKGPLRERQRAPPLEMAPTIADHRCMLPMLPMPPMHTHPS